MIGNLFDIVILVTLIVGAMCENYAIQVSDRRLSRNGQLVDDESEKASLLICNNARLLVGFTGIAGVGTFNTHEWLLKTLSEAGPPEYTALELTQRFTAKATDFFSNSRLLRDVPKRDKRVTFMFNGFVIHPEIAKPAALLITNYQDWGKGDSPEAWAEFRSDYFGLKEDWSPPLTWVQRIGNWQAFHDDHKVLKSLLQQGRPAKAVVGKAIELIREAADRREAVGTIGKQLSSIILPADINELPEVGYHSDVSTHTVYFPSLVVTTTLNRAIIRNAQLRADDPLARPIMVPKSPRNQPCQCGSGKKYKFCHGRTQF